MLFTEGLTKVASYIGTFAVACRCCDVTGVTDMLAKTVVSLSFMAAFSLTTPALSQSNPSKINCDKQASSAPTTKPQDGPQSGSNPGNMGSTGWTGGTGGSHSGIADN